MDLVAARQVGRGQRHQRHHAEPRQPGTRQAGHRPEHRLSVRSCRINRQRLAPTAARTTISRVRTDDRASSRLATLAQAISSTTTDGAEQHVEGRPGIADQQVLQRHHGRLLALVGVGVLLLQPPGNRRDLAPRLLQRHAVLQPGDDPEIVTRPASIYREIHAGT